MLHLVEVESESGPAVQVVQMDEYLGVPSNTVLLQSYSSADSTLASSQGFLTLNTASNLIQTSHVNDATIFSIPETMDNIIKLDTSGSMPGSNMPECDARELLGIVPSNIFGTGSQGPVTVQYSQEMADSQNQNQQP